MRHCELPYDCSRKSVAGQMARQWRAVPLGRQTSHWQAGLAAAVPEHPVSGAMLPRRPTPAAVTNANAASGATLTGVVIGDGVLHPGASANAELLQRPANQRRARIRGVVRASLLGPGSAAGGRPFPRRRRRWRRCARLGLRLGRCWCSCAQGEWRHRAACGCGSGSRGRAV